MFLCAAPAVIFVIFLVVIIVFRLLILGFTWLLRLLCFFDAWLLFAIVAVVVQVLLLGISGRRRFLCDRSRCNRLFDSLLGDRWRRFCMDWLLSVYAVEAVAMGLLGYHVLDIGKGRTGVHYLMVRSFDYVREEVHEVLSRLRPTKVVTSRKVVQRLHDLLEAFHFVRCACNRVTEVLL